MALQVTCLHTVLLNCVVESFNIVLKALDGVISLCNRLVSLRYHLFFIDALLAQGINLHVPIGQHLLQLADLVVKFGPQTFNSIFRFLLFGLTRRLHCLVQFRLPLLDQCFLVAFKQDLERILRVQLICQQFIVLFVVLLDVRGDLFRMRLPQSFDSLVVRLELAKLLSVLVDSTIEASFQLGYLTAKVYNLGLVVGLQGLLLREQAFLVLHELVLAFLL